MAWKTPRWRRFTALAPVFALFAACGDGGSAGDPDPGSAEPGFVLTLGATEVSALRGAPGQLLVKIERRSGFAGAVQVDLADPPLGVSATALTLSGTDQALLGIAVADDVALGTLQLTVSATAAGKTSHATLRMTVQPAQPSSGELIATALAQGRIDLGTSLLYRAFALYGDRRLPRQYVGSGQVDEDSGLFNEIADKAALLDTAVNEQLLAFTVRPTDPRSVFSARPAAVGSTSVSGRERASAVPPVTSKTHCTSGTEEWISRLSNVAAPGMRIWVLCRGDARDVDGQNDLDRVLTMVNLVFPSMTGLMRQPLSDHGTYGYFDDAVDLYILPTGVNTIPGYEDARSVGEIQSLQAFNGPTGKTIPVSVGRAPAYSATLVIPERAVRTANYQLNLIHELFHALQYAYNGELGGFWFSEASAVWAAVHFTRVLDIRPEQNGAEHVSRFSGGNSVNAVYYQYGFQRQTGGLLDTSNLASYASYIWPLFMEQRGGASRIASAWQLLAFADDEAQASDAVNNALSFETAFRDFALRNLNTAFLPGDPLPEGKRYKSLDATFPFPSRLPKNLSRALLGPSTDQGYALAQALAPLSAGYYAFDVVQSDPKLRQIRFDLGGLQVSGLNVDALVKINGSWEPAPRDLKGQSTLRFCLDQPAERLEEIWFIFSNHERHAGQEIDVRFRAKVLQAPCASEIAGRSSSVLRSGLFDTSPRYEFDVTGLVWEQDPSLSGFNVAGYRPVSGIVTARWIVPGCTMTLDPPTYTVRPGDSDGLTDTVGSVTVNYNNDPPTYGGQAATSWDANYTGQCEDGSQSTGRLRIGGAWFASPRNDGQTKENGTLIEDAFTEGADTYNFRFTLVR